MGMVREEGAQLVEQVKQAGWKHIIEVHTTLGKERITRVSQIRLASPSIVRGSTLMPGPI